MAKKTQIDRAIESMEANRAAVRVKFQAEDAAMQAAIDALYAQQSKPRLRKPRAIVEAPADRKTGAAGA